MSCANLGCSHGSLDTLGWLFLNQIRRSVGNRGVLRMQHGFVIGLEAAVAETRFATAMSILFLAKLHHVLIGCSPLLLDRKFSLSSVLECIYRI